VASESQEALPEPEGKIPDSEGSGLEQPEPGERETEKEPKETPDPNRGDEADVPPLQKGGSGRDVPRHKVSDMPGVGLPWTHPLDPTQELGNGLQSGHEDPSD